MSSLTSIIFLTHKFLTQKFLQLDLTSYRSIICTTFIKLMFQQNVFHHAISIMILNALVTYSKSLKNRKYHTQFKWNGSGWKTYLRIFSISSDIMNILPMSSHIPISSYIANSTLKAASRTGSHWDNYIKKISPFSMHLKWLHGTSVFWLGYRKLPYTIAST